MPKDKHVNNEFLLVSRKILPDYLDKVIYARELLASHEADTVTEAVQKAGISRNTYYKYKDSVYPQEDITSQRRAVISIILKDESGSLSSVINTLSAMNTSILTISQSIPIARKANVLISLNISEMTCTIDELLNSLRDLPSTRRVILDGIE
jgi:chorismate mutase